MLLETFPSVPPCKMRTMLSGTLLSFLTEALMMVREDEDD
jgi:hypothetical protein